MDIVFIMPHAWLRWFRPVADPSVRLVCFPHGGGGASAFAAWPPLLPHRAELVAIQYPGREDRTVDAFPDSVAHAVADLGPELLPQLDRPYVLFGHSMGATLAYEVAQWMSRGGHRPPRHLVVSAREAPTDERGGDVHHRDDEGVLAELARLGGTHRDVLADATLRTLILRYVRQDYRLIETYRHAGWPPLDCPVTVFLGADDPDLGVAQARRWGQVTRHRPGLRVFPGDHFYLVPQREAVVRALLACA